MEKRKNYTHAQRVMVLRKVERMIRKGITRQDALKKVGISGGTLNNWRRWANQKRTIGAPYLSAEAGAGAAGAALGGMLKRLALLEDEWGAFKKALGVSQADLGQKIDS